MNSADRSGKLRREHVARYIAGRGVGDERVLEAMRAVPREAFVGDMPLAEVYGDYPLPIGGGQTISQPYIVARMVEALEPQPADRALEIGTGSGYNTAVLARLVERVYTVEYDADLAGRAREVLRSLGIDNVEFHIGDGSLGWAEQGPYNAIIVTAAAPAVPAALRRQLAAGGRLVIPVGSRDMQRLVQLRRVGREWRKTDLGGCRFVPLLGREGWPDA